MNKNNSKRHKHHQEAMFYTASRKFVFLHEKKKKFQWNTRTPLNEPMSALYVLLVNKSHLPFHWDSKILNLCFLDRLLMSFRKKNIKDNWRRQIQFLKRIASNADLWLVTSRNPPNGLRDFLRASLLKFKRELPDLSKWRNFETM